MELLVVIAITAILAVASTTDFLGYRNRNRLNLAGEEIGSLLRTVHNRAISQEAQSAWGVRFTSSAGGDDYYYEVFYGASYPGTKVSEKHLDSALKFLQPENNAVTTTIFSQITGDASHRSPLIVIISLRSDESASTTVTVYPNGRVEY